MEVVIDEETNTLNIKVDNTDEGLKELSDYVNLKIKEKGSHLNKFIKEHFVYDTEGIIFVDEFTTLYNEYFHTDNKSGTVTNKMKLYISTDENISNEQPLITIRKIYNKKLKRYMNAYLGIKML